MKKIYSILIILFLTILTMIATNTLWLTRQPVDIGFNIIGISKDVNINVRIPSKSKTLKSIDLNKNNFIKVSLKKKGKFKKLLIKITDNSELNNEIVIKNIQVCNGKYKLNNIKNFKIEDAKYKFSGSDIVIYPQNNTPIIIEYPLSGHPIITFNITNFILIFLSALLSISILTFFYKDIIDYLTTNKLKNITYILILLSMISLFSSYLYMGLDKGGRWDLFEQIAMADRVDDVGLMYSSGASDKFMITSPYFPGVAILATILNKLNLPNVPEILITIATIIGLSTIILLAKLATKFKVPCIFAYSLAITFFTFSFKFWASYMTEFKPDSIIILLSLGIPILLINTYKQSKKLFYCLLFLILYTIGIFKQQAISIYIGLFLYLIFSKFFDNKQKLSIICLMGISGIAVLLTLLFIPNCLYSTIYLMKLHALLPIHDIIKMFIGTIMSNLIFVCIMAIYFVILPFRYKNLTDFEKKWLFISIPWFLMSTISAIKVGGNGGNLEVGILPFLPFVVYIMYEFLNRIHNKILNFSQINLEKFYLYFIITLLTTIFIININQTKKSVIKYTETTKTNTQIVKYLNNNFYNQKVLFNGNAYINIKKAGLIPVTEFDTVLGIYGTNPNYNFTEFNNLISNKSYDLIYCSFDLKKFNKHENVKKSINENYKIYQDKNMPEILQNKIYIKK